MTDSSGDVYVTGSTSESSLALDSNTLTNTNTGNDNGIFFKLSGSTGTVAWAMSATSSGNSVLNGITVDPSDNIYITGQYKDSTTVTIGTTTLNNADSSGSTYDILLLKVASSNGALLWAQSVGGS